MKHKLILEIREVASEIERSNSLNATVLKEKVSKLYDKLVVLEFLENSINGLSDRTVEEEINVEEKEIIEPHKEEGEVLAGEVEESSEISEPSNELVEKIEVDEIIEEIVEDKAEEVESFIENEDKSANISLHETIAPKKSLHDELKKTTINIGLNDRIAFVKQLFNGNQGDFNRVLSQVNSFTSVEEVIEFIEIYVKPENDWVGKEEYSERFMSIIESKFQ